MSALGNKRTLARSFDYLVGPCKYGRGNREAESLGGLEVDYEFVLCGRLHRKIGGFLALEDTINVAGCPPVLVNEITPIFVPCRSYHWPGSPLVRGRLVHPLVC